MNGTSAITFLGDRRIHMGLGVQDISKSIEFYSVLFGQAPGKIRKDYAKYEVENPPVNFTLHQTRGVSSRQYPQEFHFGIQVKSSQEVSAATRRLSGAQIDISVEEEVYCCYAVQNKVWVTDPDGHKWEVFVVLDADAEGNTERRFVCCEGNSDTTTCTPQH